MPPQYPYTGIEGRNALYSHGVVQSCSAQTTIHSILLPVFLLIQKLTILTISDSFGDKTNNPNSDFFCAELSGLLTFVRRMVSLY